MPETDTSLLKDKFPGLVEHCAQWLEGASSFRGDLTAFVKPQGIREVIAYLKRQHRPAFNVMMDLFAMDYLKFRPETPERFAVVYNLYSLESRDRLILKVWISEDAPQIESIHDLYQAANWFEREAWDLFGIVFKGHPNLVRILCHNEFQGHALRKDYPSDGYQRLKESSPSSRF